MKLRVASTVGQNTSLEVHDEVFGAKVNSQLVAQAVRVYLSNQRQGTSKTKTRSEVARTKKKWFKQKGTGNARHGARTPSLFVGGGVAHGPTGDQNWSRTLSDSMKRAALASALSAQVSNIVVSEDLLQLDGKTSSAQRLLAKMLPEAKHILVVLPKNSDMVVRSLRNLSSVYLTTADRVNTYEVAYADAIVFTKEAVKMVEDRLTKRKLKAVAADKAATTEKTETVTKTEKAAKAPRAAKAAPAAKPAKKAPAKAAVKKTTTKKVSSEK